MPLPEHRLLAKFDESKIDRDRKGRFSDKPGVGKSDSGSNGSSGGSGKATPRKKKARLKQLPDPTPVKASGEKKQVAQIEKELGVEVDAVEDEFGFERTKGNAFQRALDLIKKLNKMIGDKATAALVALQTAAVKEAEGMQELDAKEYHDIPEAVYHYLHYAHEHSADIQAIVENVIVTEADDDKVMALFREKDVNRDEKGRFAEKLRKLGRRLVEGPEEPEQPPPKKGEKVTARDLLKGDRVQRGKGGPEGVVIGKQVDALPYGLPHHSVTIVWDDDPPPRMGKYGWERGTVYSDNSGQELYFVAAANDGAKAAAERADVLFG